MVCHSDISYLVTVFARTPRSQHWFIGSRFFATSNTRNPTWPKTISSSNNVIRSRITVTDNKFLISLEHFINFVHKISCFHLVSSSLFPSYQRKLNVSAICSFYSYRNVCLIFWNTILWAYLISGTFTPEKKNRVIYPRCTCIGQSQAFKKPSRKFEHDEYHAYAGSGRQAILRFLFICILFVGISFHITYVTQFPTAIRTLRRTRTY